MFSEDQLLPISALQHLLYCPRQCALIHTERLWAENRFTVEGRHLHQRADSGRRETRGERSTSRSLPLRCMRLGLWGVADVVEFRPDDAGKQVPFPVEFKRGKPKRHDADRVQLCAQALCLEEMLAVGVPAGALFYGRTRRRLDVAFDQALRTLTESTTAELHALLSSGATPPAICQRTKCERCSLKTLCLPEAQARSSAATYFTRSLAHSLRGEGPEGGDP